MIHMRRYLIISAAAAVAASLAIMAAETYASASTVDVLTYGSAGGPNVTVNSVLKSSLKSGVNATFFTSTNGSSGGSCTSGTISEKVTTNPVAGGTADTSVTTQSFSSCSDNIGMTITSAQINTPYAATTNGNGVGIAKATGTLNGTIPNNNGGVTDVTCNYTGTNLSGTTQFTNQEFFKSSGSGPFCPGNVFFSATYNSLADTSVTGDPTVFVNS